MRGWQKLVTAILAFGACQQSKAATDGPIAKVEGWSIYKNENDCSALAAFDQEAILGLYYDVSLNNLKIVVLDPKLKSVSQDDKFDLSLFFVKGGKLDDGWGVVHVSGVRLDSGTPGFSVILNANPALTDIGSSEKIAFFNSDRIVESLSLGGSGAAIAALKACSMNVYHQNPSDPLVGISKH